VKCVAALTGIMLSTPYGTSEPKDASGIGRHTEVRGIILLSGPGSEGFKCKSVGRQTTSVVKLQFAENI
jgi:hypothetical protein